MAEADCTRACAHCGGPVAGDPRRLYCGDRCKWRAKEARRTTPKKSGPTPKRDATCIVCGDAFKSYQSRHKWTETCGRECGAKLNAFRRGAIPKHLRPVVVVTHHGRCEGCGRRFQKSTQGQRSCSGACRPSAYTWRPEEKACAACGKRFMQVRRWQATCDDQCADEVKRRGKRIAKSRRRARIRGRENEAIDPIRVFERDGWRCQLCHRKLRAEDRGTYKPQAPELDHVTPLAAGGTHTWGNVQATCRSCNHSKGGTPVGQLGLPMAA